MFTLADCKAHCKSLTYVFAAVWHTHCNCGNPDLTTVLIRPDDDSDVACTSSQVKVWQVQGHRDFLNVTVPITGVQVEFYPSNYALFNQTFNMTMNATAYSYAGYGIDAGNGSLMYYTGRNESELVYKEPGIYTLTLYALNEVSTVVYTTPIYIMTSIVAAILEMPPLTATRKTFESNVTVIGGMYITCSVSYGDNITDSQYIENSTIPLIFNHTYEDENSYYVNITCYNAVSSVFNTTSILAVDPVVNLTLGAPHGVKYGNDIVVDYKIDMGTNITVDVYVDGIQFMGTAVFCFSGNSSVKISKVDYRALGPHVINVTISNVVSGPISEVVTVNTDTEIILSNYTECIEGLRFQVNEEVRALFSFESGSNVNATVDFDGHIQKDFYPGNVSGQTMWLSHSYAVPGNYSVVYVLENAVSSLIVVSQIIVDISIENLTVTAIPPPPVKPMGVVQFVVVRPPAMPDPYNTFIQFEFGDGSPTTNMTLVFSGNNFTFSYNYTSLQNYNATVTIFNHVGNFSWPLYVELVQPVQNLSVIPDSFAIIVPTNLKFKIDVEFGYFVTYFVFISDQNGVQFVSPVELSAPNALYEVSHVFSVLGGYRVEVVANNSVGEEKANITIEVMDASVTILTGDSICNVGDTVTFNLVILKYGTRPCFHFMFGDGNEHVYGDVSCSSRQEFSGIQFTSITTTSHLSVIHSYNTSGTYKMAVRTSNAVADKNQEIFVRVLQLPCDIPEVEIYGFSLNKSYPTEIYPMDRIFVKTFANSFCIPLRKVLFSWIIRNLDDDQVKYPEISLNSKPFLDIPSDYLKHGSHEVKVSIFMDGLQEYNNTCKVYLNVIMSPLVLKIDGDWERTVIANTPLTMNASSSYDPDFHIHNIPYNFTWFCWLGTSEFDSQTDMASPDLQNVGTTGCFASLNGADAEKTIMTIDASYMLVGAQFSLVAVMTHLDRVETETQTVRVLSDAGPELAIGYV